MGLVGERPEGLETVFCAYMQQLKEKARIYAVNKELKETQVVAWVVRLGK